MQSHKCPGCDQPFQENRLPLLLRCGHTLCAECVANKGAAPCGRTTRQRKSIQYQPAKKKKKSEPKPFFCCGIKSIGHELKTNFALEQQQFTCVACTLAFTVSRPRQPMAWNLCGHSGCCRKCFDKQKHLAAEEARSRQSVFVPELDLDNPEHLQVCCGGCGQPLDTQTVVPNHYLIAHLASNRSLGLCGHGKDRKSCEDCGGNSMQQ